VHSVNTFYHVAHTRPPPDPAASPAERERAAQEHAFRIGALGLADSAGILVAALLAVPAETALCAAQVARGKDLCRAL
jgi:battenin